MIEDLISICGKHNTQSDQLTNLVMNFPRLTPIYEFLSHLQFNIVNILQDEMHSVALITFQLISTAALSSLMHVCLN